MQNLPFFLYVPQKPEFLNQNISLTDKEKEIFNTITSILKSNNKTSTICRVAGGWVRDKLLGRESIDIDIALSNMKGVDLAKMINDELYPSKDKVGLIHQNAEKGKHLETATIRVCNVWIDFVNLRSDNENMIGTPLEDAERRDITINSIFYNINENKVEDFTRKGVNDLLNGIIRTPIEPIKTFKDDPLRVLRVIRFATKYEFMICPEIEECLNKNIEYFQHAFSVIISSERITKELTQILEGHNPSSGIFLLHKYGLLSAILKCETFNQSTKKMNDSQFITSVEVFNTLNLFLCADYIARHLLNDIKEILCKDFEENSLYRKNMYYFFLVVEYRKYSLKAGKEPSPYCKVISKDILKLPNEDLKEIGLMTTNIDLLIRTINSNEYSRLKIGQLLRNICFVNLYKMISCAIAYEYIEIKHLVNSIIDSLDMNIINSIIAKYKNFIVYCEKENLLHIDEMKPLLDGEAIINTLNMTPGKEIGVLIESLINKQIETPFLTHTDAIEFLKKKREEIKGLFPANLNSNSKKKQKNKKK